MDLDETMTTSTTSTPPSALQDVTDADEGFEEDNLFPDAQPHTPANNHLNAAAPGELSPPRDDNNSTMPGSSSLTNGGGSGQAGANTSATRSSARIAAAATTGGATGADGKPDSDAAAAQGEDTTAFPALATGEKNDQPGWGWRNKKAQEEMQRAWENIVDRDFSLKEFGDVVMLGKAQMNQNEQMK